MSSSFLDLLGCTNLSPLHVLSSSQLDQMLSAIQSQSFYISNRDAKMLQIPYNRQIQSTICTNNHLRQRTIWGKLLKVNWKM